MNKRQKLKVIEKLSLDIYSDELKYLCVSYQKIKIHRWSFKLNIYQMHREFPELYDEIKKAGNIFCEGKYDLGNPAWPGDAKGKYERLSMLQRLKECLIKS